MSRLVSKDIPTLNKRQLEALQAAAPTADDILNNDEFRTELDSEIQTNYDQQAAAELAAADPTLAGVVDKVEEAFDPLADLEAQVNEAAAQEAAAAAAAKESAPAEPEERVDPEEIRRQAILELLSRSKGAPNEQQIEALKRKYGRNGLNVVAFGEGDVYIFTYLRREQWKRIQSVVSKAASTEKFNQNAEDMLREKVIQSCVIYPSPNELTLEFFYQSRAGVIDSLYEAIMLNSYFLQPQQTMMLTTQL